MAESEPEESPVVSLHSWARFPYGGLDRSGNGECLGRGSEGSEFQAVLQLAMAGVQANQRHGEEGRGTYCLLTGFTFLQINLQHSKAAIHISSERLWSKQIPNTGTMNLQRQVQI